jgi:hypothetical protein
MRSAEADSHIAHIESLQLEICDLLQRQRRAVEALRKHRGRLAAVEGKVAFVGYGACE